MGRQTKSKLRRRLLAVLLCSLVLAGCGTTDAGLTGATGEESAAGNREEADQGQTGGTEQGQPGEADGSQMAGPEEQEEAKGGQTALDKVETGNMYERAAYLTDMVYQAGSNGNTMVSPLSLDMALGLVAGGAQGRTREELTKYLGREDYGSFAAGYMEYAAGLNVGDSEEMDLGGYRIAYEIANSIWVRDDRKLVQAYADKAGEQYQAEIASVSFAAEDAEGTAARINGWCKEKTHDLIPSVITRDAITEDMATILINSLYFESPWADSWDVAPHTFTDIDGQESQQEMLVDTLECYYENEHATAFSKRYMNDMMFIGILPKETGEFGLQDLDLQSLLESETGKYEVQARMPKLNFETTAGNIVQILQAQGVETVFSMTDSDLSGLIEMEDGEVAYVSDIIQKCKLELDENGTRAAAVTMVMAQFNSLAQPEIKEQKEVYLDRPFAFMIYDSVNEQIVFVGKVVRLG